MEERFDWRGILGGVSLGLAAIVLSSSIFSRRRATRKRTGRILDFLARSGILPKRKKAHVGPIPVPDSVEGIPEAFLRAFR